MKDQSYTTTILVNKTPEEAFNAVRNVRGWWSQQIEGGTENLNDEFIYHYKEMHRCKMKLVEVVQNERVVWLVLENHFSFTKDKTEWVGNHISFEISKLGDQTQLVFTQTGMVPANECFEICSDAWGNYIHGSLKSLIETGKGNPNPYVPPQLKEKE